MRRSRPPTNLLAACSRKARGGGHSARQAMPTLTTATPRGVIALDFDDTLVTNDPQRSFYGWCRALKRVWDHDLPSNEHVKDSADYQTRLFAFLHRKHKTIEDILRRGDERSVLTPGMKDLLQACRSELGLRVALVTDNNTVIVARALQLFGVADLVDDVVANVGIVEPSGRLAVAPYHLQTECELCYRNLCKGRVLASLAAKWGAEVVAYCGDGPNDLCPMLRLAEGATAFPREGYPIDRLLSSSAEAVSASVAPWSTGHDILRTLRARLASSPQ